MLVISHGFLNDLAAHRPFSELAPAIRNEIAQALAIHVPVVVVTPAATPAAFTTQKTTLPAYASGELQIARGFGSPNVYTVDLLSQMKQYITAHHLNYESFAYDGWHPNSAGHALAGALLAQNLAKMFR